MGAWVVGIILVAMAALSIVGVMYMVMREHHGEADEWYDPNKPESTEPQQTTTGATVSTPATQTPAHENSE
jgi:hypothetical protein